MLYLKIIVICRQSFCVKFLENSCLKSKIKLNYDIKSDLHKKNITITEVKSFCEFLNDFNRKFFSTDTDFFN